MTLFSKIITGQIPSYKIFEDEKTFAFLDIKPNHLGHTLLIPKIEIGDFSDLPADYLQAIFSNAQKLSKAIKLATNCKRVGLVVHGMGIPDHFHLHLIPMFEVTDLDTDKAHEEDNEKMKQIQEKIIALT